MVKLIPILFLAACAVTPKNFPPVIDATRYVENSSLPVSPKEESLPDTVPAGVWSIGVEEDEVPHPAGILISEELAYRFRLYVIKYDELRVIVDSDRSVIKAQRDLYEETIRGLKQEVQELQPNWYDRNKGLVWGVVGAVVGGGLVYGISR